VLKFDRRTQTWSEVAPMPAERDFAGACVVGSDIYIFGGHDDDEEATSTTTATALRPTRGPH
jgi:N-acetylneuraminic acid mutarotase